MSFFLIGAGSPLVDYTAEVPEAFLKDAVPGCKGGTLNISDADRSRIFAALEKRILRTPGGAAANTVCALGRAGVTAAFFGKTGLDEDGEYFRNELKKCGVSPDFLLAGEGKTGYCVSLVTPDAERTMRSNLGVSTEIVRAELENCRWQDCCWLLTEGYMLAIPGFEMIFDLAKDAGCSTALDISSIEIARKSRESLPELLKKSVDLIFCNADEAAALTGISDPDVNAGYLADLCGMAAVKLGAAGSLVKRRGGETVFIEPCSFGPAVDTTAAGDTFTGFFLSEILQHGDATRALRTASVAAGIAVSRKGAEPSIPLMEEVATHL